MKCVSRKRQKNEHGIWYKPERSEVQFAEDSDDSFGNMDEEKQKWSLNRVPLSQQQEILIDSSDDEDFATKPPLQIRKGPIEMVISSICNIEPVLETR